MPNWIKLNGYRTGSSFLKFELPHWLLSLDYLEGGEKTRTYVSPTVAIFRLTAVSSWLLGHVCIPWLCDVGGGVKSCFRSGKLS